MVAVVTNRALLQFFYNFRFVLCDKPILLCRKQIFLNLHMWADHNVFSFKRHFEKCSKVSGQKRRDLKCGFRRFIVLHPLKLSSKPYLAMWNATSPQRPLRTTASSPQQPPLYNGHLSTTATSLQRPPLCNGHLSTTTTSLQRPPLYNDHLSTTTASLQRPPLYNDNLSTTTTTL